MKEHPILFSAPMVRAILADTKTQTRRVATVQPTLIGGLWHALYPWGEGGHGIYETEAEMRAEYDRLILAHCPYGKPGDRLWVRETWRPYSWSADGGWGEITYQATSTKRLINGVKWSFADAYPDDGRPVDRWRPSIHMPRWASRILLEVVSVRVERLQSISESDAQTEGIEARVSGNGYGIDGIIGISARDAYEMLWERINGADSWASNPWVWAIAFKRVQP